MFLWDCLLIVRSWCRGAGKESAKATSQRRNKRAQESQISA
jgi:hypothetical protein